MRTAKRAAWIGGLVLLLAHCRIERIEPAAQAPVAAPLRTPAPTSPVLVGAGVDDRELQAAAASACTAIAAGDPVATVLQRALGRLECGRRARGSAFAEASLLTADRWGAASAVPAAYLASEAAAHALHADQGLVYGAEPLLALAPCEQAPSVEMPQAPAAQQQQPEQIEAAGDADAGREPADEGERATTVASSLAFDLRSAARPSELIALLLRGHGGDFGGALLSSAAAGAGPPGFSLLPGQRLLAGAEAVVFVEPATPRDFLREPAPAARLFAARDAAAPEGAVVLDERDPAPGGQTRVQPLDAQACARFEQGSP